MTIPDRIDIIAAAALQAFLLKFRAVETPEDIDIYVSLSLDVGRRYAALREQQEGPPAATKKKPNVIVLDPLIGTKRVPIEGRVS